MLVAPELYPRWFRELCEQTDQARAKVDVMELDRLYRLFKQCQDKCSERILRDAATAQRDAILESLRGPGWELVPVE